MAKLILPALKLFARQPDPPHRHRVIASFTRYRRGCAPVIFKLCTNWPRTAWYVYATEKFTDTSLRASNTLRTTSAAKARLWEEAIREMSVRIQGEPPDGDTGEHHEFHEGEP